jgi:putative transposase
MIYTFIATQCTGLPVEHCCRVMKVSRSAYFHWQQLQTNPTERMLADRELTEVIGKIHDQSFGTYGVPRVTAELRLGLGRQVNHKRVERIMREQGLQGVTRRRRAKGCTRSRASDPRADDLVHRQFRPTEPDRLWVQDITQHRTTEGWVYLAVVIDAWSRRVVGWSIADHLRAELVVDALEMARLRRQPSGTTVHSDHGSQYCSWVFGQRLRRAGLFGSMGTVGDALDNAVAESFFASLQCELLDRHRWDTRADLARAMFHWIEAFYNPTRRHSTLGYRSPVDFETAGAA